MAPERDSHCFLFADLVGFTAFMAQRGDDAGVEVALELQRAARSLAADCGAEVVKAMGDAVMVHGYDAWDIVCLGLRLADELRALPSPQLLRVGVHTGPAIGRDHDWYGNTVNVAARLAEFAREGEVLVSERTARSISAADALELVDRGSCRPRGVLRAIQIFEARSVEMREPNPVAMAV